MYTTQYHRLPVPAAVFLTVLLCSQSVAASDVLIGFDFEDESGVFENIADISASGLDTSGWQVQTGTLLDFGGNPGRALAARNFVDGNVLVLEVGIAPGLEVHLDRVAFDHFGSSSGPSLWGLRINGVDILGGDVPASFEHIDGALSEDLLSGLLRVEIWGSGASSNNGTYRVDNFELAGVATPVPVMPAIFLFGSALGMVPLFRAR